jgi:hypothetical protein
MASSSSLATASVSDTALALGEAVQSNEIFWAINE